MFRKVGGGIQRRGKNKTPTKPVRKGSNEAVSEDDLSDREPSSPKSSLKVGSLIGSPTSTKKSVTIGSPLLPNSSIPLSLKLGEVVQSPRKTKSLKLLFVGLSFMVLVVAFLFTPDPSVEVHITSLSALGGDAWWAPVIFKAIFLLEV